MTTQRTHHGKVVPIDAHVALPHKPRRYVRLSAAASTRLNDDLSELIGSGSPGKADYRALADLYGVSVSTVEKRAAKLRQLDPGFGHADRITVNKLPLDVKVQLAAFRQIYATWEHYHATGQYRASYATFRRQLHRSLGANTVRGILHGVSVMRRGTFEKLDRPEFMQGFSIDLFYLRAPLAGLPDASPVGALVREASTGLIVASWVWPDDTVTASDVMTLLAEAFRGRTFEYGGEAVFVGGVPDFLRCDNGGQFTASEVGDLLNPLAVRVVSSGSYRSHELGGHERVHGVMRKQLLDLLPRSENGPRDHRGILLPDSRALITLDEVREVIDQWVWRYNTRDTGQGSRMDDWVEGIDLSEGFLPRTEDASTLARFAVQRPRTVKVRGYGLQVANGHYTCPELRQRAEKRFYVRQWLRDHSTIEVFTVDGEYVGTGVLNGELTAAESDALIAAEREDEREVHEITAQARSQMHLPALPNVPVVTPQAFAQDVDDASGEDDSGVYPISDLRSAADAFRQANKEDPS